MTPGVDVTVENHGTLYRFVPLTETAKSWVTDNVQLEAYQWMGDGFVVEHRYARDLAEGMVNDGLVVR